jgi:hypothetical protein
MVQADYDGEIVSDSEEERDNCLAIPDSGFLTQSKSAL